MLHPEPMPQFLATVALACAIAGTVLIALLHRLRCDLSIHHRFVSEYAVDTEEKQYGWMMQLAFALLALCALCLGFAVALGPWMQGQPKNICVVSLIVTGLGAVVMYANKTDLNVEGAERTSHGQRHDVAALVTFVAAMFAMASVLTPQEVVAWVLIGVALPALLIQLVMMGYHRLKKTGPYRWVGVTERALIIAVLLWAIWIGWRLVSGKL
jgi:hypothetical protein